MAFDPGPLPSEPQTPEEEVAYRDRLAQVLEEKRRALADPGPDWREWLLYHALKWYIGVTFLIVDSWIVVTWIELGNLAPILPSLLAACYLEFLAYRLLWYRPPLDRPVRSSFRPTFLRPVRFGRWTPEAALVRSGKMIPDGPSAREFL